MVHGGAPPVGVLPPGFRGPFHRPTFALSRRRSGADATGATRRRAMRKPRYCEASLRATSFPLRGVLWLCPEENHLACSLVAHSSAFPPAGSTSVVGAAAGSWAAAAGNPAAPHSPAGSPPVVGNQLVDSSPAVDSP